MRLIFNVSLHFSVLLTKNGMSLDYFPGLLKLRWTFYYFMDERLIS